jgi:tyrosyl-tRNA synthetase
MLSSKSKETSELLTRGVGVFIDPDDKFKKKLEENPQKIVIKFGVDPTRPDIHLGHAVVFRKLRKFQDLGCKVVFLIGDFTSIIGDPTGKSKVRPELSQKEIESNMKTFVDQVGKILKTDEGVFSWIRNSDWFINISDLFVENSVTYTDSETKASVTFPPNSFFAKTALYDNSRMQKTHLHKKEIRDMTILTFLSTLRSITHSRLIGRDMFQERINGGGELYMHEMMYPVLQGIDSSILALIYGTCDLEVGGTDQTFNMIMGRDIMKANKQEPQAVLAFELLEGLDGKEKMSKSADNYIAITDEPNDMFGKVMSIPDSSIVKYFELCTYTPTSDIEEIKQELTKGKKNPKDIKMRLAREIVEIYHGREKAGVAEKTFNETFSKGTIPDIINEIKKEGNETLGDILVRAGVVSSKTEFRRLVDSKAIEYLEKKTTIDSHGFIPSETGTYRVGKKRFVKIII